MKVKQFSDKKMNDAYTTIFEALSEVKRSGVNADEVLLAIKYLTSRARREGIQETKNKLKLLAAKWRRDIDRLQITAIDCADELENHLGKRQR